jgi:hypothetical protein
MDTSCQPPCPRRIAGSAPALRAAIVPSAQAWVKKGQRRATVPMTAMNPIHFDPALPISQNAELSLGLHRPFDSSSSFHLFCKRLCMLWILKVNFPHDHTVLRRFERGK